MKEQQINSIYEPVAFVYTETIGSKITQASLSSKPAYTNKYQDILIPNNQSQRHLLYLFHTPAIYNWLRTLDPGTCEETTKLISYIQKKDNAQCHSQTKAIKNALLGRYAQKWQIAKLCLKNRIEVKGIGDVQGTHLVCRHLIKSQIWSQFYVYDFVGKDMIVDRFYCKECEGIVKAQVQVKEVAWTPMFENFYGQTILIRGQKYTLFQIYLENSTAIRAANKLWYRSENPNTTMKVIGGSISVNKKQKGIFVYIKDQIFQDCGILHPAKPITWKQEVNALKQSDKEITSPSALKKTEASALKTMKKMEKEKKKKQEKVEKVEIGREKIEEDLEMLPEKDVGQVLGEVEDVYRSEISKHYVKQKEKDEYEKDYDKGKTKKIKKKYDYPKPDYNEIFKQVKNAKPFEQEEEAEQTRHHKFGNKNFRNRQEGPRRGDRGKRNFRRMGRHEPFDSHDHRKSKQRHMDDRRKFNKKWQQS